MKSYLKDNKDLMKEYNYEKNTKLNLEDLTLGSGKKIWWKCKKGHEWEAAIYSRKNNGCPVCVGRIVVVGYNDLATTNPNLLKEWDYEKNNIDPKSVLPGSSKKVWWKCKNGHSYFSEIRSRAIYGYGCKYCAGHKTVKGENDFATSNPSLLKEWDYEKNKKSPSNFSAHSHEKVWWICPNGHSYLASIGNRNHKSNPTNCPYCYGHILITKNTIKKITKNKTKNITKSGSHLIANDFKSKCPQLMEEWDYEKNSEINPSQIYYLKNIKVWWKCKKCGYEWKESIYNRVKIPSFKHCPMCTQEINSLNRLVKGRNDLKTLNPRVASEWNYEKNTNMSPDDYTIGSNKKVWWKCKSGHEWNATISSRAHGTNCPICSSGLHTSFPEQAIYYYLNNIYKNVDNRFVLDEKYEYDIFIQDINTLIEYDGVYYHNNEKKSKYDLKKEKYALNKGFVFYRIKETNNSKFITSIKGNVFKYYPDRSKRLEELIKLIIDELNVEYSSGVNLSRDYINIENMIIRMAVDNSLFNLYPEIASEWNYEKNNNIDPRNYLPRSGKIVWWKCKSGHVWKTRICDRLKNGKIVGCPYCSNRQVLEGFNDFAFKKPQLLKYWNYQKNYKVKPTTILYNSGRKVWWQCPNGHSYRKEINKKDDSNDCPYCNGRKILKKFNDFGTLFPDVIKDWNYEKNNVNPLTLGRSSEYNASWKCNKCGYEWNARIIKRCNGLKNCPICTNYNVKSGINDLVTTNPELLKEWHQDKNGKLLPENISFGSTKQVWWKCQKCGYEWKTSVSHRTISKNGCPACAKKDRARKLSKRIINLDTGEIFESLTVAAKKYNLKDTSGLTHCIQGKTKTCVGFKWDYYND